MILNYDSKNNSWGTIIDSFKPNMKGTVKTTSKELSSEIQSIFNDMDLDGDLWVQLDSLGVNIDALTDTSIKDLSVSLGGIKEGTITAGDALKQLSTTTVTVTEKTSKAASAMKTLGSIGKTALSLGANMLASYAVAKGIELIGTGIYNVIHASEIAIEKGEEARDTIAAIDDAYNTKKTFNDALYIERQS